MVVNAAVVDLYPTKMRGMAICMVMLSGRIGSILASFLVGYLLIWNCQVTFILFGVSLIGMFYFLSLYLNETDNVLTFIYDLDYIRSSFEQKIIKSTLRKIRKLLYNYLFIFQDVLY